MPTFSLMSYTIRGVPASSTMHVFFYFLSSSSCSSILYFHFYSVFEYVWVIDAAIDAMLAPYINYNSYDDERDKRDVSPLTAESMQGDEASQQQWRETSRKRRDLTDAEIAALLETSPYEGASVEEPSRPEDLGDLWRQELIDMYGRGETKEPSLDKDVVDSRAVLRYLYGELAEEPSYENEISEEFDDEKPTEVEPIFYHGRAGLFVPAKRQFISAVPGVRKRSGGYRDDGNLAYLQEYAGEIERKRNENERERLYALALALNAANDM